MLLQVARIATDAAASETFDDAIGDLAEAYADLNEQDHRAFVRAVMDARAAGRHDL
ncbi:MAG: DUF2252 family protein [Nocardioidaceae bacterium]|nr:DUF2252 family protein [Nocardioidaceae bacterium]NUS52620.1 DUF2252 family protein [Nocardioidaceae bacterium]